MNLETIIHTNDPEHMKEVVERLTAQNVEVKLDSYLKKFDKDDAQWRIELSADKNKKGNFDGKLGANLDGQSFHYAREDYENLDDLVNHLFDHLKVDLSNM